MTTVATVAWLGVGGMGGRMARRLLAAGHDLRVWNRTPARAEALTSAGARVAATPADAVRQADVVIVMVADPAALRDVTAGPDGVPAGVAPGTTVIDMSTVGPDAVARLASALPEGVALLDAPVMGSIAEADAGTLTLFIGGPTAVVTRHEALLSTLGIVVHCGPSGAGAAAKLVANSALFGAVGVLGEAVALADGLGLPREATWRLLAHTPLAAQAQRRQPAIDSHTFRARFALTLARKDSDLVVAAADAAGTDVPIARAVRFWLAAAEAAGLGAEDYTAVLGHILARDAPERPNASD